MAFPYVIEAYIGTVPNYLECSNIQTKKKITIIMTSAVYKIELQLQVKPRCQADTLGQICQSKDKAIVS